MKCITIAGRVGKDAVTRTTQGGDSVTGFPVAVDDGWGDKKRTIWFDVSVWGKRGSAIAGMLTKGKQLTVSGDLSTREHEGKTYLTIRAHDVTLQGGGDRQDTSYSQPASGQAAGGYDDLGDDLPFAPEWRI